MTQETQISATTSAPLAFFGFDPTAMMQAFTPKLGEASASGSNPAAGWLELQQHWMSFLSDRFKQDANLFQKLRACTNPSEMTEACASFYAEAATDYQGHISKIATLGQQALTGAAVSVEAKARPNGKA